MIFNRRPRARNGSVSQDFTGAHHAELKAVTLTRGTVSALVDIDLSLSEAKVALIGRNGSGKSSLARLLNGLLLPDTGDVHIFGRNTREHRSDLPRDVGFVFQNPDHQAIFPTVEEEIAFGLTQLGEDKQTARDNAQAFLTENGCGDLATRPFLELSEGQKQLVCILAVLVMQPRMLVLDEPFSSLDHLARRLLMQRVLALPQRIVLVSHDLEQLEAFDRVIWLDAGRIRMDGRPEEVAPAYLAEIERLATDRNEALL